MISGNATIDGLLAADVSVQPLSPGTHVPAVGYLQDLLRCHGYSYLPDPRLSYYGTWGASTTRAVADYRRKHSLATGATADSALLRDLVQRPATQPQLSPAWVPLVLDTAFTDVLRFVWLTSLFETGGLFAKMNLNTDECGVSFGILQWSQRAGQLHNFFHACSTRQPGEWETIMGTQAGALLDYTARPNGGVDPRGFALDPAFELTKDPWKTRLDALGGSHAMQRVQLELASETYDTALLKIKAWTHPDTSERTLAFLLDLTNQFGPGRVQQHYAQVAQSGVPESEILKKMEDAFTALSRPQFQQQVRGRREFFRTTALLADV
jgi:hypothetical protein